MIRTRIVQVSGIALCALAFSLILTAWLASIAHGATLEAAPPVTIPPVPTWMEFLVLVTAIVVAVDKLSVALAKFFRRVDPLTKTPIEGNIATVLEGIHTRLAKVEDVLEGVSPTTATLVRTPDKGSIILPMLFVMAGFGILACATVKAIPPVADHAVVDCTKQESGPLLTLTLDFVSQIVAKVTGGTAIDWDALETQAEHEGTAIGQCAFVEVWAKLHPAKPPTDPVPAIAARYVQLTALDRLRAKSGGVSWKLVDGTVK